MLTGLCPRTLRAPWRLIVGLAVTVCVIEPVAAERAQSLPSGLTIRLRNRRLVVARGRQTAPLAVPFSYVNELRKVVRSGDAVTLTFDAGCEEKATATFTLAQLDARLDNAAALDEHRAGRWDAAATGFAAAVAADPAFDLARQNLASALTRAGRTREAVGALEPLLRRNPVKVAWRVNVDPDLAPLATEPEIAALVASAPGTIDLSREREVNIDPTGRFIAAIVKEQSWGSAAYHRDVHLLDAATGELVLTIPLVKWNETDPYCEEGACVRRKGLLRRSQGAVKARIATVQKLLRDLGFSPVGDRGTEHETGQFRFASARIGIVSTETTLRIVRRNAVLREVLTAPGRVEAATLISGRTIVAFWGRPGSEGCEGVDPRGVLLLSLPQTKAPRSGDRGVD